MAKVYETPQDFEREKITNKEIVAKNNKEFSSAAAASFGLLSVLYFEIDSLKKELQSELKNVKNEVLSDCIKGWATAAAAIVSVVMVFVFSKEKNELKNQTKKLGAEQITLPKHSITNITAEIISDNHHTQRVEKSRENLRDKSISR